jgi:serine phosphatase RsbU (regulator of sigma subunit)
VIPSATPDEQQSDRPRKAMHVLAKLGAVVAPRANLQPMLDRVVLKTTGMLQADEGRLRLVNSNSDASQTYLRVCCNSDRPLPEELFQRNQNVINSVQPGMSITSFYGELDPDRGMLRFVNAGHNHPLLRRAGGTLDPLIEGSAGGGTRVKFRGPPE